MTDQKNIFYDYFSICIILLLGGAFSSFLSLGNSQLLTQEKVLTQGTTISFTYMILAALFFIGNKIISGRMKNED